MIRLTLAALLTLTLAPGLLRAQERRYVDPRFAADTTALPFSGGVLVGNTFYMAGKIGLTPDRKVPSTAAEEARLVLEDMKAHAGPGGDDHGRPGVGAGLLLRRGKLRRVQPGLPHLLQAEFPGPGLRAFFGFDCMVFMGELDVARQKPNVFRMRLLGAEVSAAERAKTPRTR